MRSGNLSAVSKSISSLIFIYLFIYLSIIILFILFDYFFIFTFISPRGSTRIKKTTFRVTTYGDNSQAIRFSPTTSLVQTPPAVFQRDF